MHENIVTGLSFVKESVSCLNPAGYANQDSKFIFEAYKLAIRDLGLEKLDLKSLLYLSYHVHQVRKYSKQMVAQYKNQCLPIFLAKIVYRG